MIGSERVRKALSSNVLFLQEDAGYLCCYSRLQCRTRSPSQTTSRDQGEASLHCIIPVLRGLTRLGKAVDSDIPELVTTEDPPQGSRHLARSCSQWRRMWCRAAGGFRQFRIRSIQGPSGQDLRAGLNGPDPYIFCVCPHWTIWRRAWRTMALLHLRSFRQPDYRCRESAGSVLITPVDSDCSTLIFKARHALLHRAAPELKYVQAAA